ncbi:anhydro-N-acetylmuramic acid kinase [Flavobacterium microcysteis]|uniref:Anhydro-N-acetylmuramic acid kinase n=1 Tax=Flavobacterium microcysteis TaxID=2596891 RepID=A0A501QAR2_9FLAO|nr:anhydro-N-acetylmuramic acid kinase [Flavobacterium microcysteis]TPD69979.1 anhydro-N-acetylmuramic acid kinase [Flavobacterium microcysteis]
MAIENYNVIGVMSGTSLDGIDLALIIFHRLENHWQYQIKETKAVPYTEDWISRLKKAVDFSQEELEKLNKEYTLLLGNVISDFIAVNQLENLDGICSHGHTILHQPQNGFTLQIGNLPEIAKLTNQKVICDFRVQDVEYGGQGAPLVPIGDRFLFPEYDFCLNLGGFSNISFEQDGNRIAFDISPVNTVLNFYASLLGLEYDDKGTIARSGTVSESLLQELNTIDFYAQTYPKSLGYEFVKTIVLPMMEKHTISTADKLRTFVEHIAIQTSLAVPKKTGTILATGGGAYNVFLLERMAFHLPEMTFKVPDDKTVEYKEALIFALLGVLKLRNEVNVLASVTGAKHDHSSGKIFLP